MSILKGIPRWRQVRAIVRLTILLAASVVAFLFGFFLQIGRFGWGFVAALGLGVLSVAEFVLADLLIESRFPRETRRFLERLQDRMSTTAAHEEILRLLTDCIGTFRGCSRDLISSTVHLKVDVAASDPHVKAVGLVQVSDYTKAGLGGRRWRVLDSAKGIVGRCVRTERLVWVNFRSA